MNQYQYIIRYFHGVTWVIVNKTKLDDEIMEQIKKYKSLLFICSSNNIQLLYDVMDMLPVELEYLYLEVNEEMIFKEKDPVNISFDMLPMNLKNLQINIPNFNQSLDNLPLLLKTLIITSNYFDKSLNNLPLGLERLEINSYFVNPLENIPLTLKFLNIQYRYPHAYLKEIKKKIPKIIFNNAESGFNNL